MHPGNDRLGVMDEHALGNLEHQARRVEPGCPERLGDVLEKAFVLEMAG